ncbi:MAG: hypothetical protein HYR85_28020 [Planctomycetes bacterium]|nr:hypothetical protein [Planctomycetota bacterium]MBI3845291.1 hypothetical protein [Planctomycetota bacterium]
MTHHIGRVRHARTTGVWKMDLVELPAAADSGFELILLMLGEVFLVPTEAIAEPLIIYVFPSEATRAALEFPASNEPVLVKTEKNNSYYAAVTEREELLSSEKTGKAISVSKTFVQPMAYVEIKLGFAGSNAVASWWTRGDGAARIPIWMIIPLIPPTAENLVLEVAMGSVKKSIDLSESKWQALADCLEPYRAMARRQAPAPDGTQDLASAILDSARVHMEGDSPREAVTEIATLVGLAPSEAIPRGLDRKLSAILRSDPQLLDASPELESAAQQAMRDFAGAGDPAPRRPGEQTLVGVSRLMIAAPWWSRTHEIAALSLRALNKQREALEELAVAVALTPPESETSKRLRDQWIAWAQYDGVASAAGSLGLGGGEGHK